MDPVICDVQQWLEDNKKFFAPPICNKLLYKDGQLKMFLVGGPNSRKDFHIEAGEEFFYMLKGSMNLIVVERGQFKDIIIKEGEVFLLPRCIAHSPQRIADTIGAVVERERTREELDCLRYYVSDSQEILYEKWFHCESLEKLGPLIKEFFDSEQYKTGKPVPGSLMEDKPLKQDLTRILDNPFSLKEWLKKHRQEIDKVGKKRLFDGDYLSRIFIYGKGSHIEEFDLPETILWQMEGDSQLEAAGKCYKIPSHHCSLINKGQKYTLKNEEGNRTLVVIMNPTS